MKEYTNTLPNEWIWMGHAGHFCASDACAFKLNTYVNGHIISTVGEYIPSNAKRFENVGSKLYETMVFKAKPSKNKCCPFDQLDGCEIDGDSYDTPEQARIGHIEMCKKWAE